MDYRTAKALAAHYQPVELQHFIGMYLSCKDTEIDNALCVLNRTRIYPIKGETRMEENIFYTVVEVNPFKDSIYTTYEEEQALWYRTEEEANTNSYNYSKEQSKNYPISRIVKVTKRKYFNHQEWIELSEI